MLRLDHDADNRHGTNPNSDEVGPLADRPCFSVRELDYELPEELIAQIPGAERSASRMLVVRRDGRGGQDKPTRSLDDRNIADLPEYLRAGDALVLNDTRVLAAKFQLERSTGGRVDGIFLETDESGRWDVLLRGAQRLREGEELRFVGDGAPWAVIAERRGARGRWLLRIANAPAPADVLRLVGRMPLPPYIKRGRVHDERDSTDEARYQTVYAAWDGAVAAPTAGLHFTPALLQEIETGGVAIVRVTLHVGYGTFAPLEVADLADHTMHTEYCEMGAEAAGRLTAVRRAGGRVVAVGTTSARVLESAWRENQWTRGYAGRTDLFCYPPCEFGGVDALLTNFHLPRSTLLALVMAFVGVEVTREAYAHAIAQRYRFYSYGDAMLIV
jgi:S-adenosylmethionine:tRNA ribosyltransferase-isomerase